MKKMLYMTAIAAVALSSCSDEAFVENNGVSHDADAVLFSAYEGRQTRGEVQTLSTVGTQGFGVFAYDQGNSTYAVYSALNTQPNFFYNQKVAKDYTSYVLKSVSSLNDWAAITDEAIASQYTGATINPISSAQFTNDEKNTLEAYFGSTGWGGITNANTAPDGATLNIVQYKGLSDGLKGKFELDGTITAPAAINRDAFNALAEAKRAYYQGVGEAEWVYSPIKYYDNNSEAQHSFFAYAPYQQDVNVVFANSKAPQIRYTSADDYDLMWGCEWKKDGSDATEAPMDVKKPSVTEPIAFNFKHALSNVTIKAVPFIDEVHGDSKNPTLHPEHSAYGTIPAGTTVTLRSVKFVGANFPSKALLNLQTGDWEVEATDENAYDLPTAIEWNSSAAPELKSVLDQKMIIPSDNDFQIRVIYDVETRDELNPKNNSKVVNTITSTETFPLKAGTAYMFHLDLGLTSVKFDAKVIPWSELDDVDIDMPNNALEVVNATQNRDLPTDIASLWLKECAVAPNATAVAQYYYNTISKKLYKSNAVGTENWEVQDDGKEYLVNSRIYKAAADGPSTPNVTEAPRWWMSTTNNYHLLSNGSYSSAKTYRAIYETNEKAFWKALNANSLSEGVYLVGSVIYYVK